MINNLIKNIHRGTFIIRKAPNKYINRIIYIPWPLKSAEGHIALKKIEVQFSRQSIKVAIYAEKMEYLAIAREVRLWIRLKFWGKSTFRHMVSFTFSM